MMKFVRSVPMAICGLSLGLAALGNLLLPYGAEIRYICGILSAVVLFIFALKLVLDFPHANAELKTPVPLSTFPTATMALMLLCVYIRPFYGEAAVYIWYAAAIAHLCIMLLFFKRFIIGFKVGTVFPSWFIAFVGIVVVSVTAPAMGTRPIGQAAFYAGFVLYFIALALVLYKMSKPIYVLEPLRLTTAIFTAPMSLCIVGYFSSFEQRNETLVYFMLTIAVVSYIYVSIKMLHMLNVKFYPTYSAFTFPYVISARAFRLCNAFLVERGINFFAPVAQVSLWLAVAIVAYVFVHYIKFFRFVLRF
jgi:exfoliative toxin A/B